MKSGERHERRLARFVHIRPITSFYAIVALVATGVIVSTPGRVGAATPVSQATGDFLSGTALGVDLATLVSLQGAAATNTGSPATVEQAHPLDVTALSLVNVSLGGGLQLLGGVNPILDIGAANQYARANNDGSSYGASGAVDNQGAVSVGAGGVPQGDATINLNPVISSLGLSGVLSNARLSVGALAGTATQTAAGAQSGTYEIADLNLDLTSPLVAAIKATVVPGVVGPVQTLLDGLGTLLGGVVTAPDLQTTVNALGNLSLAGGTLLVNLDTGAVHVDVGEFLAFHGININAQPPNTDLTAVLHTLLAQDLLNGLTSTLNTLITDLVAAVNTTTVAGVPVAVVTAALAPIITQLTNGLQGVISSLTPTVIDPVLNAVDQIAQITLNKQTTSGGTFTETALAVALVPASPLATVNLASASVGPNAGPAAAPPTSSGINPNLGPTTGGQTVTITGTNFVPGATTVTIGGILIPANQVTVSPTATSLTFLTPPHAEGLVDVTVSTPGGTTAPLGYTYVPPPTGVSLNPTSGPTTGGTTVTMTGTGFVAGQTSVTIGGTTIPASQVTVAPDGTTLTFVTPPHAPGTVGVTATTPGGTTAPLDFTYVLAPPVITSPANGAIVGPSDPISGTGVPGATVTVSEGGSTICTATVDVTGHRTCTPTSPLAPGPHTVSATQTVGGDTSQPSAAVSFTVAPVPTASTIDPSQGPASGGQTVTITGTDFIPGQTTVTIGGNTVPANQVTVSPDGTSLTFVTPPHAPGAVDVTVTTPGGTSGPLTYTYVPDAPKITSPTDGQATGPQPPIKGTGTPGDTVTVKEGNTVLCTATVKADGTWACTPVSPLAPGDHTIVATQTILPARFLPRPHR